MCFGSSTPPPATPEPAAAPAPPAIPAVQSAASTGGAVLPTAGAAQSAAQAATPSQQIGFARKAENKKRYGKSSGPQSRRTEAVTPAASGDTGAGIRM